MGSLFINFYSNQFKLTLDLFIYDEFFCGKYIDDNVYVKLLFRMVIIIF